MAVWVYVNLYFNFIVDMLVRVFCFILILLKTFFIFDKCNNNTEMSFLIMLGFK